MSESETTEGVSISTLLERLIDDPWRKEAQFSPELAEVHSTIFSHHCTKEEMLPLLEAWLTQYQPCLFGRHAAKIGLITYCLLTEADLLLSDGEIAAKIQEARLDWTSAAFEGEKSGFVIWVVSPKIAYALPDENMLALAQRLASLYLQDEIEPDAIYTDEVFLEIRGRRTATWKWRVGVNYFCAQGDGRWWQDHRIPAGMAFSMNSVGHMVKATQYGNIAAAFEKDLGVKPEEADISKVDSLENALRWAMQTIALASESVSGKATRLLNTSDGVSGSLAPQCPIKLPSMLVGKDHCRYAGYYHTDVTLPTEYFSGVVERPEETSEHELDFTYLFDKRLDNSDYVTMGTGLQIRGGGPSPADVTLPDEVVALKRRTGEPEIVGIDESPLLVRALNRRASN